MVKALANLLSKARQFLPTLKRPASVPGVSPLPGVPAGLSEKAMSEGQGPPPVSSPAMSVGDGPRTLAAMPRLGPAAPVGSPSFTLAAASGPPLRPMPGSTGANFVSPSPSLKTLSPGSEPAGPKTLGGLSEDVGTAAPSLGLSAGETGTTGTYHIPSTLPPLAVPSLMQAAAVPGQGNLGSSLGNAPKVSVAELTALVRAEHPKGQQPQYNSFVPWGSAIEDLATLSQSSMSQGMPELAMGGAAEASSMPHIEMPQADLIAQELAAFRQQVLQTFRSPPPPPMTRTGPLTRAEIRGKV